MREENFAKVPVESAEETLEFKEKVLMRDQVIQSLDDIVAQEA